MQATSTPTPEAPTPMQLLSQASGQEALQFVGLGEKALSELSDACYFCAMGEGDRQRMEGSAGA